MSIIKFVYSNAQKRDANLLPLRLFIGLGWLRAAVEKGIDPDWYSDVALLHFFAERIAEGNIVFPFYLNLMTGSFTEYAAFLSTLIVVGEFFVGLAILFGLWTIPALIAGLFMNLNFILAGSVNPSAFYIIIQLVLLNSKVGHVFGIDGLFASFGLFQPTGVYSILTLRYRRTICFLCALITGSFALSMIPYIRTFDPAQSIEDVAMLLLILLSLGTVQFMLLGIRIQLSVLPTSVYE